MFYFQNIYYLSMLIYEFIQTFIYLLQYITSALQSEIVRNMIIKVIDKSNQGVKINYYERKIKCKNNSIVSKSFLDKNLKKSNKFTLRQVMETYLLMLLVNMGSPLS